MISVIAFSLCTRSALAQGNYEIQVYGADTVAPKTLMTELHSNFTPEGQKYYIDGVIPTNHQEHETLELTEGITSWSEIGFYVFTSEQDGHGVQLVGRPHPSARARARSLASSGRSQSFNGNRLSTRGVFAGHMDMGDTAHHR